MLALQSLIAPVTGLLDKFIEDKDQKNALAHEIATMSEKHAVELSRGQLEINKVEASSTSLFVSGWRPAVAWVCVLGMAANFVLIPMANFALAILESDITVPLIDTSTMMPVLMGMLGLGAMRTVEKINKVSREK